MSLSTEHLQNCLTTLDAALEHLNKSDPQGIEYDIFRNASIKGFELSLETAGKLLRKTLKLYTGDPRNIDSLTYKEILRLAGKHALLTNDAVERWLVYRDNRNNTAHDYGAAFAEETLKLIPQFIKDAQSLQKILQEKLGSDNA